MSTITYFPYEQELIEFCETVDVSDYKPSKNWGGWKVISNVYLNPIHHYMQTEQQHFHQIIYS